MKNKRHREVAFEVLNPKVTAAIVYTKPLYYFKSSDS